MRLLYKKVGETPLECIHRNYKSESKPLSYAGRLDPMAEGLLLILEGDECRNREKYLGLSKTYDYKFVLGISTDSLDLLGKIIKTQPVIERPVNIKMLIESLKGNIKLPYPAFSSKPVLGKSLFMYAKSGQKVDIPMNNMTINKHRYLEYEKVNGKEIAEYAIENIKKVNGNFRQREILTSWKDFMKKHNEDSFFIISARLDAETGTYVRSLVKELGNKLNIPTTIYKILRTRVGDYTL